MLYEVKAHGVTVEYTASKQDAMHAYSEAQDRNKQFFLHDVSNGTKKEVVPTAA